MMNNVIETVENMIRMEKEYALSLSSSVEELSNLVVGEILRGIAHDSQKHAGFYKAILNLLGSENPALNEEDYARLENVIKTHIKMEEQMIRDTKTLLEDKQDSRVKHLLIEIYGDEIKHHILMKRLLEAVIKREAIFDIDLWESLWSGVPGHGSPGG
jgi:rubrerythrin